MSDFGSDLSKGERIVACMVLLVVGGVLIGYGFTGIDFAIASDVWNPEGQKTKVYPVIGELDATSAFNVSMLVLIAGIIMIVIAAKISIWNSSTVQTMPIVLVGVLLIAWGIWGVAFAVDAMIHRLSNGWDEVGLPCPDEDGACGTSTYSWLVINIVMILIGIATAFLAIRETRFAKIPRA